MRLGAPPSLIFSFRRKGARMHLSLIILGICEIAAMIFIWRLWRRHHRRSLAFCICWSVVLAVPVGGIIFYGLALNDPSEQSGWGDENNQGWGDDYTNYRP